MDYRGLGGTWQDAGGSMSEKKCKVDEDGHCLICGLSVDWDGNEHECPPGFLEPIQPADDPDAKRVGGLVEVAFKKADEIFHGDVDQLHKFNRFQLANYILWGMNYISSRLAEAEEIADAVKAVHSEWQISSLQKAQKLAREYRKKYPKGENL